MPCGVATKKQNKTKQQQKTLLHWKDDCFPSLYTEGGVEVQQGCRDHISPHQVAHLSSSFLLNVPTLLYFLAQCRPYYSLSGAFMIASSSELFSRMAWWEWPDAVLFFFLNIYLFFGCIVS